MAVDRAEPDALDEVALGRLDDVCARPGVDVLDRPARPDLGGVGARVGVGDDRRRDFLALRRIRQDGGEMALESDSQPGGEDRAQHREADGRAERALGAHDPRGHPGALGRNRRHRERGDRRQAQGAAEGRHGEADDDDDDAAFPCRRS